jgi:lambda family phage minor tail protein L
MTISRDIHSLEPGAIVELYEIDLTPIDPAAGVTRFHAGTNELREPVVWQGHTYAPRPVSASGFGITIQGAAPRPKFQVSNIPVGGAVGMMTLLNRNYDDLVGAIITRRRALVKYLDAVNFPGSVNPTADPTAEIPLDVYYVERRVTENRVYCEYELSSIYDLTGVMLPGRTIIRDTCMYSYRIWDAATGSFLYADSRSNPVDCPYTGTRCFDALGALTATENDCCGRRLSDCRLRFSISTTTLTGIASGVDAYGNRVVRGPMVIPQIDTDTPLPFGAFPGAGRY